MLEYEVMRLTIVTVCMNRRQHLLSSAAHIANWPHHHEHLLLDWSSREPVRREELPNDSRITLQRVEGETCWNLCRAYNLAIHLAKGSWLLKLDADCWPGSFDPTALIVPGTNICWFGSGPNGRIGQFLMHRTAFEAVGGFNEVLVGYGFDDKDLKARLASCGWQIKLLPVAAVEVISHSIHERVSQQLTKKQETFALEKARSFAERRATAISNRVAAAHHPWTFYRSPTSYRRLAEGVWQRREESLPCLDPHVEAELRHLRRLTFWSRFLEIPELHVKQLPRQILPSDQDGHFTVHWWHRLHWHILRRLQRLPLMPLMLLCKLARYFKRDGCD